ncbi:MAG: DUF2007 domain-containing protein [Hyphomicrobiaceae bacterium]|jgi:hypothetical protein
MREIMRTNDIVVLSFAENVLRQTGIEPIVMDANMSVMEGSIGMFPRRLMVADDDEARARRALRDADLTEWLISP